MPSYSDSAVYVSGNTIHSISYSGNSNVKYTCKFTSSINYY